MKTSVRGRDKKSTEDSRCQLKISVSNFLINLVYQAESSEVHFISSVSRRNYYDKNIIIARRATAVEIFFARIIFAGCAL